MSPHCCLRLFVNRFPLWRLILSCGWILRLYNFKLYTISATLYDWILRKTQHTILLWCWCSFKNTVSIIQRNVFTYFSLFDVLDAQYLDSISKTRQEKVVLTTNPQSSKCGLIIYGLQVQYVYTRKWKCSTDVKHWFAVNGASMSEFQL